VVSIREPAANPCGSCPLRRDAPPGLWAREEYAKLPAYDRPTGDQPMAVFMCHQVDGRVCAGWAAVIDGGESMALRIAVAAGHISVRLFRAIVEYRTATPVHDSCTAAAEAGLAGMDDPPPVTRRHAARLVRKGKRLG
jgi:hypothetical protein